MSIDLNYQRWFSTNYLGQIVYGSVRRYKFCLCWFIRVPNNSHPAVIGKVCLGQEKIRLALAINFYSSLRAFIVPLRAVAKLISHPSYRDIIHDRDSGLVIPIFPTLNILAIKDPFSVGG